MYNGTVILGPFLSGKYEETFVTKLIWKIKR